MSNKDPEPEVLGKRAACGLDCGGVEGRGLALRPGAVCVQSSWLLGPEEAPGRVGAAAGLAPRLLSGPERSGREEPAGRPGPRRVRVPCCAPGWEPSLGDAGYPRAPGLGGQGARPRGEAAAKTSETRQGRAAGLGRVGTIL